MHQVVQVFDSFAALERSAGGAVLRLAARYDLAVSLHAPHGASVSALEALKRPMAVRMFTDSDYLRHGITTWLPAWKERGWRTADKNPVKNQDLWQRLEQALGRHRVEWHWVRGHSGNPMNERADQLATEARRTLGRG